MTIVHFSLLSFIVFSRYYPYHYAPFASDLKDLPNLEIIFSPGEPFKPFDQLMGVLPASSSNALPEIYRDLMTNPSSPIFHFYPADFEIDMNGKKFAWQGVAKLPFIDEKKLLSATRKLEDTLTMQEDEQLRNSVMLDLLYVNRAHELASHILLYYQVYGQLPTHERCVSPIKANASGGMNGYLWACERNVLSSIVSSPIDGLPDIESNQVLNITYLNPSKHVHIPKPPDGVVMPKKLVKDIDIKPFPMLWHEDNAGRGQQGRERPQLPGAITGFQLGEAAHRLVKNTLNVKLNNTSHVRTEQPPVRHTVNRFQSAGPSGYGTYYGKNTNSYNGEYNHHGVMTRHRYPVSSNGGHTDRQNFRIQDRSRHQEQLQNVNNGFSSLTMEERSRPTPSRQSISRPTTNFRKQDRSRHQEQLQNVNSGFSSLTMEERLRPTPSRQSISRPTTNFEPRYVQNTGPPIPPPNWNTKAPIDGTYTRHQEATYGAVPHDKSVKKVYQVKTRLPQETPDSGNQ